MKEIHKISINYEALEVVTKIGEKKNQIYALDLSTHLNLFATGSSDGLITIWDFEISKIEDICYVDKKGGSSPDVYNLKFLDPFPILASTYSDGSIYFWGVKPGIHYRYECFIRMRNFFFNGIKEEVIPILCSQFTSNYNEEIPKAEFYRSSVKRKTKKQSPTASPGKQTQISKTIINKNFSELVKMQQNEKEENTLTIEEDYFSDTKYSPEESGLHKKLLYIVGDMKGQIKIFDIQGIVAKFNIEEALKISIKSDFNIFKKEDLNLETQLNYFINKQKRKKVGNMIDASQNVLIVSINAHSDSITSLSIVDNPICFLSSSKDKTVKIWSFKGECLGNINILQGGNPEVVNNWNFDCDWKKMKEEEIMEVLDIYLKFNFDDKEYDVPDPIDDTFLTNNQNSKKLLNQNQVKREEKE